ncbi:MAG: SHOCT domain-containing protein [Chloroflexi bacterium]|nr:SHOCT domain-containing protein [Chloroflexota bacterium]MBM3155034.1 SHOCT domain-containing protein [Chloroflexota bacterium]MBM3175659.1 SHOCT domain-containing protein [Chloroflexota bacterium]
MMWNWWGNGFPFWMVFGGLWMLLFWGLVIWLIVWGIKKITESGRSGGKGPLDIAKERYARGEISQAEFEQMKKDLS